MSICPKESKNNLGNSGGSKAFKSVPPGAAETKPISNSSVLRQIRV